MQYSSDSKNATIPPSEDIAEAMTELGLTPASLARKAGLPRKVVDGLLNASLPITKEAAAGLEKALGMPARLWLKLEADYQETKARLEGLAPTRHAG